MYVVSHKTLIKKVNSSLFLSSLLALLMIIISLNFRINLAYADRSELGLGLRFNFVEQLTTQTFDTNLGDFVSQEKHDWSKSEQLIQVGLGLSFSSSIWLQIGLSQNQTLLEPSEHKEICIDPEVVTAAQSGPQSSQARCTRLSSTVSNRAFHSAIAYNYKPFDDLSPFFELSLAVNYEPNSEFTTVAERLKQSGSQSMWAPLNLGITVQRQTIVTWYNRLRLGFEKRIMSRWGVRLSTWFSYGLSNLDQSRLSLSYGFSLDMLYYRYIRLL